MVIVVLQNNSNSSRVPFLSIIYIEFTTILGLYAAFVRRTAGDLSFTLLTYAFVSLYPLVYVIISKKYSGYRKSLSIILILSASITLIYTTSLGLSWHYLFGFDINGEFYFSNEVLSNGYWNPNIAHPYNSVPSVTILAPEISMISGFSLTTTFKIIYPLIFSLIPFVLWIVYSRILNNESLAFFASLFFVYLFTFYTEMLALARQMIAEFLIASLLLLLTSSTTRISNLSIILLFIGISLSHYSVAYLFMFALMFTALFRVFLPKIATQKGEIFEQKISISSIMTFSVITIVWYNLVAGGVSFANLVNIGKRIINYINELFNPIYSQGAAYLILHTTPARNIARALNLIAIIFIIVGIIYEIIHLLYRLRPNLFFKFKLKSFNSIINLYPEFFLISLVFFMYDVTGVIIPFLASSLNATRLYQLSLIFLSPFFIKGFQVSFKILMSIRKHNAKYKYNRKTYAYYNSTQPRVKLLQACIISIFLIFYSLSNSGTLIMILNDPNPPLWLNDINTPAWSSSEALAALWTINHVSDINSLRVIVNEYFFPLFLGYGIKTCRIIGNITYDITTIKERCTIEPGSAITLLYTGRTTVVYGYFQKFYYQGSVPVSLLIPCEHYILCHQLSETSKIYNNNKAAIYLV